MFDLDPNDIKEAICQSMERLDQIQKTVIEHRFCLDGKKHMTLRELGVVLDVCPERIRYIEVKSLRLLRSRIKNHIIIPQELYEQLLSGY